MKKYKDVKEKVTLRLLMLLAFLSVVILFPVSRDKLAGKAKAASLYNAPLAHVNEDTRAPAGQRADVMPRVLYLSAYSYYWQAVPLEMAGIQKILGSNAIINYEFMDTKNTHYSNSYTEFYNVLSYKLKQRPSYDAVIIGGDEALDFTMHYRDNLFPDTPIVFMGVANYVNAEVASSLPWFTGVSAKNDFRTNLELAAKMRPNAKKVTFLVDHNSRYICKQIQKEVGTILKKYKVEFLYPQSYSRKEMVEKLQTIKENDIFFAISMSSDKDKRVYTSEESHYMLQHNVYSPIFRTVITGVGDNMLGGYIVDEQKTAEKAAKMVYRILFDGIAVDNIDYVEKPEYKYYMDQNILDVYDMTIPDDIEEVELLNRHLTFFEKYQKTITICVSIFATIFLLGFFMVLTLAYRRGRAHNRQLQEVNESLRQANAAKTDFLSRMSHDMRTPMNVIIGMTELAMGEQEKLSEETMAYFKKINSSADFLLSLINDILDMAKIERGEIELKPEPIRLRTLLEDIDTMIRPLAKERNQILHIESNAEEYVVLADDLRLKKIFFNLLSNAVKFTPEQGDISLHLTVTPQEEKGNLFCHFVVQDTGVGMSDDFLKKLFTPFTQETNQFSNEKEGTGLGLSIAKNIINCMNGTINVESRQDRGTTFSIDLVLPQTDKKPCGHYQEKDNSQVDIAGLHALVVDDQRINAEIVVRLLKKKGVQTDIASNGKEAVEWFKNNPDVDLILMDVRMPVMDGIEATRTIRALPIPQAKTVSIIALTANAFEDDRKECMDAGMSHFLAKPIDVSKLYPTLEYAARSRIRR